MFEELLIQEVRKHECLYKRNSISYTNKLIKYKAWNAVANAVGDLKEQCQSRWRSLRDRYVKEVNKKNTLGRTKWKFMDQMAFLKPYFRKRHNSTSSCRKNDSEIEFVDTTTPAKLNSEFYYEEPTTSRKRKLHTSTTYSTDEQEEFIATSQTKAPYKIKTQPEEESWSDTLEEYVTSCKQKSSLKINQQTTDDVTTDILEEVVLPCETKTQSVEFSMDMPSLHAYNAEETQKISTPTVDNSRLNIPEENVVSKTNAPCKNQTQTSENNCSKPIRKTQMQAMDDICSLIGTVKELVAAKCSQNNAKQKSRNSAFLSMLDDYLQKMNEEQQDVLKVELINYVVERSAEMKEN